MSQSKKVVFVVVVDVVNFVVGVYDVCFFDVVVVALLVAPAHIIFSCGQQRLF